MKLCAHSLINVFPSPARQLVGEGGWGDRLTADSSNTYTYDAIGNPQNYNGYTLAWNGRQLVSMTNGSKTNSYKYNDEGIRTSKTVDGVEHIYTLDGSRIVSEAWGNNLLIYLYDESGSPVGMQYRTSSMAEGIFYTFYFEKNLQGDIVAVYTESGVKVVGYTYDAWGNFTTTYYSTVGTNWYALNNPFRYRGYYYDSEIGLYYLQSRYYNPQWGRFLNADGYISTGQGVLGNNMFVYCGNNPVNRTDISGMLWKEIGTFFSNTWNGIKVFAKNTFGAGSSTTATIVENETPILPDPLPITAKVESKTTQTITEYGNSSRPISVYADKDLKEPVISSTAGIKINIGDFTLDICVGLDDIGVSGSLTTDNITNSFGAKLNLSEVKVGFEGSTAVQWDNTTTTSYINASGSGWAILAAYFFVTTGQPLPSPSYAN